MADYNFSNTEAYENLGGRWSTPLARLFLDFTGVHDGERALDVGCGTGVLCRAVLDAAPGSEVTGVDPSEPFIEYARAHNSNPRASYEIGNAMALPYPDAHFGQALSICVFQYIPDQEKGAGEMRRVTRPGGTVAASTWGSEGGFDWPASFWEEVYKLDPAARKLYGPSDLLKRGEFTALWDAAGLENVEETGLEFRVEYTSFEDYWLPFLESVGSVGAYIQNLSPEGMEALGEALRKRFLGEKPDGPFTLGARAWAVRGTVPE
jgi:SAM-dependent methyltransferase